MIPGSKIVAMGHYQPSRVVTNDDLAKTIDTNDAWIRDRVGIAERRIADSETVADMAAAAAGKALAASGLGGYIAGRLRNEALEARVIPPRRFLGLRTRSKGR
jgi:hypothetical protein